MSKGSNKVCACYLTGCCIHIYESMVVDITKTTHEETALRVRQGRSLSRPISIRIYSRSMLHLRSPAPCSTWKGRGGLERFSSSFAFVIYHIPSLVFNSFFFQFSIFILHISFLKGGPVKIGFENNCGNPEGAHVHDRWTGSLYVRPRTTLTLPSSTKTPQLLRGTGCLFFFSGLPFPILVDTWIAFCIDDNIPGISRLVQGSAWDQSILFTGISMNLRINGWLCRCVEWS